MLTGGAMPSHFRTSWLFVIVTDGDPLDLRTHVKNLFIAGKPVDLKSKHTDLYEIFSRRP